MKILFKNVLISLILLRFCDISNGSNNIYNPDIVDFIHTNNITTINGQRYINLTLENICKYNKNTEGKIYKFYK